MYTSDITTDIVMDALEVYLRPFVPGEIIQAQTNRVPMPKAPSAVMTDLMTVDLSIPNQYYDNVNLNSYIKNSKRFDIQVDFYGHNADSYCTAVKNSFAVGYGFDKFPANIKPLYTSDGIQSQLIGGEQQFENRWTLTLSLQVNPIVVVPQDSANIATVVLLEPVDIF